MRQFSSALAFLLVLMSSTAFAGGAPAASGPKFDGKTSEGLQSVANQFVQAIVDGQYEAAYQMGGETLRTERTLEAFTQDITEARLDKGGSIEWNNGTQALPAANGFKLMGEYTSSTGNTFPVYMHLEGDAHVLATERNRQWDDNTKWTVLDYRSGVDVLSTWNRNSHDPRLDSACFRYRPGRRAYRPYLRLCPGLQGHPRELADVLYQADRVQCLRLSFGHLCTLPSARSYNERRGARRQ